MMSFNHQETEETEDVNAEEEMQNTENDNSLTRLNCKKDWVCCVTQISLIIE